MKTLLSIIALAAVSVGLINIASELPPRSGVDLSEVVSIDYPRLDHIAIRHSAPTRTPRRPVSTIKTQSTVAAFGYRVSFSTRAYSPALHGIRLAAL